MSQITVTETARAEYTLPVPMGSPQSYLGIHNLTYKNASGLWQTDDVNKAPGASGSTPLSSQGFWSAVLTRGGQRSNGDAYSPANNGGGPNASYDPQGYRYTVDLPLGTTNGRVFLFDATFCAVGHHTSGSYLGTGDHWIGTGGLPVTTEYTLWNTRNTPFDTTDDFQVADSGTDFTNENQVDKGTAYSGDLRYSDGGYDGSTSADCQADSRHNDWYQLAQNLAGGTYGLQVKTSNAGNAGTNAENMFGIQAVDGGAGQSFVHGTERMAMYNNLNGGTSLFYMAQIDSVHAGKTWRSTSSTRATSAATRYPEPQATQRHAYIDATFSYTADNGRSGTNVTLDPDHSSAGSPFNNSWITIVVPLPSTYGRAETR